MTPQEFVDRTEQELALVAANEFAAKRAKHISTARSEFGSSIAREVDDAIPDDITQFRRMTAGASRISTPGISIQFRSV